MEELMRSVADPAAWQGEIADLVDQAILSLQDKIEDAFVEALIARGVEPLGCRLDAFREWQHEHGVCACCLLTTFVLDASEVN
jgi:hypothetical protein